MTTLHLLAAEPGGNTYAEALRLLFNLGPQPTGPVAALTGDLPVGVELAVQLDSDVPGVLNRAGGKA